MNILLVEDNPSDMRLLKELFEDRTGAPALDWVTDGHEALDYVFRRGEYENAAKPDAILLDLGLPRISGYDVLKQLKEHHDYSDIPVIILTTSRNPLDRDQCKELGADTFLSKPRSLDGYEALAEQLIALDLPRATAAANPKPPRWRDKAKAKFG